MLPARKETREQVSTWCSRCLVRLSCAGQSGKKFNSSAK